MSFKLISISFFILITSLLYAAFSSGSIISTYFVLLTTKAPAMKKLNRLFFLFSANIMFFLLRQFFIFVHKLFIVSFMLFPSCGSLIIGTYDRYGKRSLAKPFTTMSYEDVNFDKAFSMRMSQKVFSFALMNNGE